MIDEWGGTLTLTEASSRELMRVLKEQDDVFMDNLFNGKCGFTLKCTDGRSVELVPTADRKTEPQKKCKTCEHRYAGHIEECMNCEPIEDEPQTERSYKK
ncbi:MAG: hypothetical protein IJH28_05330 [Mogibacterium sp.]|nr:hypothetical protein [Mogibacterium sp.]